MSTWTLSELVAEAGVHIARLPTPKNGQVRAVPDERTVRYYAALGLLDRPAGMRGRTAQYGQRHLAQVVAIKRLQSAGRSLAEIQALWPALDDATLQHMTGIQVPRVVPIKPREFWKKPAALTWTTSSPAPAPQTPTVDAHAPLELRVELAPNVTLVLGLPEHGLQLTSADIRALRAAAQPLLSELGTLADANKENV